MRTKNDNKIMVAVCLFTVLLFSVGLMLTGAMSDNQHHNNGSGVAGAELADGNDHPSDADVLERRIRPVSFSAGKEPNENIWNLRAKNYFDSILAVLFKIAVIPCVIFFILHFVRDINTYIQRIVFDFVYGQDGKKRIVLYY